MAPRGGGGTIMKRRSNLILRLLLLAAAAASLPALVGSLAQQAISERALLQSIEQEQRELGRRLAEEVNGEVRHTQGLIALIAHSSFITAGSRVDHYEALRNLLREAPALQEAMLVNVQGDEFMKVAQNGPATRLMRRRGDFGQSFLGDPFFSGNRAPTVLIGEPLRTFSNPTRSGVLLAKLSFTSLGDLMQQAKVGQRGKAYIVNQRGDLLAHPEDALVYSHANYKHLPVVQEWLKRPGEPTGLSEYTEPRSPTMVALAYPIPLLKSAVIVEQPKADVYAPVHRMRMQSLLWTSAWVVLFIWIAVALAWRILQPIRQLQVAAEQVGQGNMDIRLDIRTGDELEELGGAFQRMAQSLSKLERLRRDLISMVVHDLKMPISTILPSLETLLSGEVGPLSGAQKHFVEMSRRSSHEMLLLVENVLDVARMEEGKLTLQKEKFLPADWAENVVGNFRPMADAGKKRLELVLANPLPVVEGDIVLLSRVLGNLLSNALRHTPEKTGEITVSLYPAGSTLAVEVRDNGEGIPEEDQHRIFDKFVQAQGRKAVMRSGTGLGLTFCKMIVEAHGGRIAVFSQPNEGSVFTFHLPIVPMEPETPHDDSDAQESQPKQPAGRT
jgi:signal transduction histidine kinase